MSAADITRKETNGKELRNC